MGCNSNTQQTEYKGVPLPETKTLSKEERDSVMAMVVDTLMASGLPNMNIYIACGIAGNIKAESTFNYTAVNKNGCAYGLCQWYNTRLTKLYNWCKENGCSYTSPEGQLKYLIHELKDVSVYKNVYATISSPEYCNDIDKIAYYFCMHFEVPGEKYCKSRPSMARQVFEDYKRLKTQTS